jgi:hypothetical protein
MLAALAPRPVFISAPLKDDNFKWQSVDRVTESARQVYRLYGKPDNLMVQHPDCEHDFPDAVRQFAYDFLTRSLE